MQAGLELFLRHPRQNSTRDAEFNSTITSRRATSSCNVIAGVIPRAGRRSYVDVITLARERSCVQQHFDVVEQLIVLDEDFLTAIDFRFYGYFLIWYH